MKWILLSSASSEAALLESIKRFYGGEEKAVIAGFVIRQDGSHIEGVRVKQKAGRWRFEMEMGE